MASAACVMTGAVQPSTSPGDSGLHLGTASEGKRADRRCRASCTAEENWMVPAGQRRGGADKGHAMLRGGCRLLWPRQGGLAKGQRWAPLRSLTASSCIHHDAPRALI